MKSSTWSRSNAATTAVLVLAWSIFSITSLAMRHSVPKRQHPSKGDPGLCHRLGRCGPATREKRFPAFGFELELAGLVVCGVEAATLLPCAAEESHGDFVKLTLSRSFRFFFFFDFFTEVDSDLFPSKLELDVGLTGVGLLLLRIDLLSLSFSGLSLCDKTESLSQGFELVGRLLSTVGRLVSSTELVSSPPCTV